MVDTSRRGFLSLAGRIAGGAAVVAVPSVAIAAIGPDAEVDPVFDLAERFLVADRESNAAYGALDEFEPWQEWRTNNPKPELRQVPPRPNTAWDLNPDGKRFFDMTTGERLGKGDPLHPGEDEASRERKEAMRRWKRREAAAKRRTGYRELEKANEAAKRRFFETQEALTDCIPLSWDGLAAKSKAFRKTYAHSEHWLMLALMRDIAVLSGQIGRDKAVRLSEEEITSA
jgi:hypothetical protein